RRLPQLEMALSRIADDTFSESSLYRAGHAHLFHP
ncbi:hypothetical protein PSYPI_49282, partial [Pseudomonas syringae pv. pisi str. 1704B]